LAILPYTGSAAWKFIERDSLRISFVMVGLKDLNTGGYLFNFKMADALNHAGHEVDVIHFSTMPENIRGSRLKGSLYVLCRVLKYRPDLLVISKSYSFMVPLRMFLSLVPRPVLYLVHHLEWHDRKDRVSRLRKALVCWFIKAGNRVWVNSRSTADDVVSLGISRNRLSVISPGFDRFSTVSENRRLPVQVLTVGSVCARKDQLTLVKACTLLKDLDFRLVIAGDESADIDYSKSVREKAAALGDRVTFTGHISADELHDAYNSSHILANLSVWEGYGIAVAEAMWAGLPVVAVNAGAVPELVTHGENGFLVGAEDAEVCASCLKELIVNETLRGKMSYSARKRAEELFSWQDTGREFVHLAEETAGC
jgi:glycosyltransferase involved in cell wall biosynthesis